MAQANSIEPQDGRQLIARPVKSDLSTGAPVFTAPEKAAVIIALLGPDAAGPIVEKIEDCHLRSFMSALENINQIPRESILAIVAEFITELRGRRGNFKGGADVAKELADNMFSEDRVVRLFGAPPPPAKPKTNADKIWALLSKRPSAEIAKYLAKQKSAVGGIVLSQLTTVKTGEILSELPEEVSVACVAEMSKKRQVDANTLDAIAELIETDFFNTTDSDPQGEAAAFVGEVLGVLPQDRREKMLEALEASDPKQAALIRENMFTFEDLEEKLPVTAIPNIFRDFDRRDLILALKAGEVRQPNIVEFLYNNISNRMSDDFKEETQDLKGFTLKQGDAAIGNLMTFIMDREKDGRIVLKRKPSEEEE